MTMNARVRTDVSSSSGNMVVGRSSANRDRVRVNVSPSSAASRSANKKIENAVYAYIRAVRALGRTSIGASEIADALSLSVNEVKAALDALTDKGVKVIA